MSDKDDIRNFISANFVTDGVAAFSDDDDYFAMRFVNSLFAMRLVNFIEKKIGFEIDSKDLSLENFSTINRIMKLMARLKNMEATHE